MKINTCVKIPYECHISENKYFKRDIVWLKQKYLFRYLKIRAYIASSAMFEKNIRYDIFKLPQMKRSIDVKWLLAVVPKYFSMSY